MVSSVAVEATYLGSTILLITIIKQKASIKNGGFFGVTESRDE
jgi:MFS-type transporter involved in bile tolerance (Atg22 family)